MRFVGGRWPIRKFIQSVVLLEGGNKKPPAFVSGVHVCDSETSPHQAPRLQRKRQWIDLSPVYIVRAQESIVAGYSRIICGLT